jgi:N6-L-threonylcarbamoyladenine synthase
MTIIGETTDDAVRHYKSAKIIGLPYQPLVDKYAQLESKSICVYQTKVPGLDFSFSGLKTAILYFIQRKNKKIRVHRRKSKRYLAIQYTIIRNFNG